MSLPTLLIGFFIATLYAAIFHFLRGGGAGQILLDLLLSWIGFGVGQALANFLDWNFFSIGQLHLGMATLISLIFLLIGNWLSRVDTQRKLSR